MIFAGLVILPVFLGGTAWLLDRAFYRSLMQGQEESMRLQQLLLARAADWDGSGWQLQGLDEIRFEMADSGLFAFILNGRGEQLWSSPSAETFPAAAPGQGNGLAAYAVAGWPGRVGDSQFGECYFEQDYFCHRKLVAWGSSGPEHLFLVIADQAGLQQQLQDYRSTLALLLLLTGLILIVSQLLIVYWGMRPLRALTDAIRDLEGGEIDSLSEDQPPELKPLAHNLNLLISSERRRRERVRNTMDRLAHVLKSPLMVLRNSPEEGPELRRLVDEQVDRMQGIVEGELARGRLDGRHLGLLGKPVVMAPVLARIAAAYSKLPRPGGAASVAPAEIDMQGVAADAVFFGETRDLQDLFGTVLENALRYCNHRVVVAVREAVGSEGRYLLLVVGDDGDGVPAGQETDILQRGARADSAAGGHGLGLAIVVEIVSAYGGALRVGRSELGGAEFTVELPGSIATPPGA